MHFAHWKHGFFHQNKRKPPLTRQCSGVITMEGSLLSVTRVPLLFAGVLLALITSKSGSCWFPLPDARALLYVESPMAQCHATGHKISLTATEPVIPFSAKEIKLPDWPHASERNIWLASNRSLFYLQKIAELIWVSKWGIWSTKAIG